MARAPYYYPSWTPPASVSGQASSGSVNRSSGHSSWSGTDADNPGSGTGSGSGLDAATNSTLPVVYGRAAISPLVFVTAVKTGFLYLGCAWCHGEIEEIEDFYDGAGAVGINILRTSYLGTPAQGVDPDLVAALPTYADTLVGTYMGEPVQVAYTVLRIRSGTDIPNLKAVIKGRKVRDPRTGLVVYSTNAALCLADFIESRIFGLGVPVNDASLIEAADYCDELVGGLPRHTLNLGITNSASVSSHIDALRTYAKCWVVKRGGEIFLVPDRVSTPVANFDESLMAEGTISIEQRSGADIPTVIAVNWTDSSAWEWKNETTKVYHPDVLTGQLEHRLSSLDLPGIHDASEAYRAAVERLNYYSLTNLQVSVTGFDEAGDWAVGDVLRVTHQWGLGSGVALADGKLMRITQTDAIGPGRYNLDMEEYDPAVYSDDVVTAPTYPDTGLPDPCIIPYVTGLYVVENVYEVSTGMGVFASRMSISHLGVSDYPYSVVYHVRVWDESSSLVFEHTYDVLASILTPALPELETYLVEVRAESALPGYDSCVGPWNSKSVYFLGRYVPPPNVSQIDGFEAGDTVFLSWNDVNYVDVVSYEVRYVAVGGTWPQGILVGYGGFNGSSETSLRTSIIPAGQWDFMVKAIDSTGVESTGEARTTIQVTLDSFHGTVQYEFTQEDVASSSNVSYYVENGKDIYVSDCGTTWDALFPNSLDSYTDSLDSYTTCISEWYSETKDWGSVIEGSNWSMDHFSAYAASGSIIEKELQLTTDSQPWVGYPSLFAADTDANKSRAHVRADPGSAFRVEIPLIDMSVSRETASQSGNGSFTAGTPTTIILSESVYEFASITVTATTPSAHDVLGVADNTQVGPPSTFDVYLVDSFTNTQITGEFSWEIEGVISP